MGGAAVLPGAVLTLAVADSLAALGPEWDPVFAAGPGVQSSRTWFAATEAAALPAGAAPCWVTLRDEAGPLVVLPMQRGADGTLASLTTPYTVLFQPLLAERAVPFDVGRALGRVLRRAGLVRLEALDPDWPALPRLLAGVRAAGLVPLRFEHFGNWHERVEGGWAGYLATRPGQQRSTIRRRTAAAARDPAVTLEIVRDPAAIPAALAAYDFVYARSWKEPEPFPDFNRTLLPGLAADGVLWMAVMRRDGQPIAAQYWTVGSGIATVLKLAHDEAAKALSPGTVLTAHVIQAILDQGAAHTLDFGRGDDPYKQTWVAGRRQRIGYVLAAPWRPAGFAAALRHGAGRLRRGLSG